MIGLKIQGKWLSLILSGQKTMEVRSVYRKKILGETVALGNSNSKLVEGYAFIKDIIVLHNIQDLEKYQNLHLALSWLSSKYSGIGRVRDNLYGYVLTNIQKESNPFPYPKSPSIWFNI